MSEEKKLTDDAANDFDVEQKGERMTLAEVLLIVLGFAVAVAVLASVMALLPGIVG